MRLREVVLMALLCAIGASGCLMVQPHERGTLSLRLMALDPDPVERKLDGHVAEYREGSIGRGGAGGGGCGCN